MPYGGQPGGRKTQILTKGFTIIKIYGNGIKRDIIESPVETIKGTRHPAIYPEYVIKEIAVALKILYNDTALRLKMGEAASRRAKEYYLWPKLGDRLGEIYQAVLK